MQRLRTWPPNANYTKATRHEIRKSRLAISWCAVSWSFWLVLIPTACYTLAAAVYGVNGNWPMSVVYAGYSFANCGLLALDVMQAK
jgi:hypothetical protein